MYVRNPRNGRQAERQSVTFLVHQSTLRQVLESPLHNESRRKKRQHFRLRAEQSADRRAEGGWKLEGSTTQQRRRVLLVENRAAKQPARKVESIKYLVGHVQAREPRSVAGRVRSDQ